ncbi:MAG: OmpH family outer membrane protein [Gammaproteobacteria bacterium]
MKNTISTLSLIFVVCLLIFSPGAYAENYKLGVVNAVRVLEAAPQAEHARTKLEKEFASRDRELVAAQKELKQLEDRLAKDGAIMGDAERTKVERDALSKKRELKRSQDEFRDDLNLRRNEEFSKIQKLVVEAIQAVAQQGQYDLILGEGVIFASNKVDITDQVIQRLKQDYQAKVGNEGKMDGK